MAVRGYYTILPCEIDERIFDQNEYIVRDINGRRWCKCRICGHIGTDRDFWVYGGADTLNYGRCYECPITT